VPGIGKGWLAIRDQATDMVTVAVGNEDGIDLVGPDACIGHIGN